MTYQVLEKYLSTMGRVSARVMAKSISNARFMGTHTKVGARILMTIYSSVLLVESKVILYKSLLNKKG
jgi:adenosylcobinamide amidohydrolase